MDPVLIGGDFNMPIEETQNFAGSWIGESRVLPTRPNLIPSCNRGYTTIDHIIIVGYSQHSLPMTRVLKTWDMSDHYPVMVELKALITRDRDETPTNSQPN